MDEFDRAIEALKIHIKKEIIDNYFAERVYLEEDTALLDEKVQAYRWNLDLLARRYFALYQALGSEAAVSAVMEVLSLQAWPFYQEYRQLPPEAREDLLKRRPRHGLTARRRFYNLVFDLYEEIAQESHQLREQYDKIAVHLKLLNEDIDKFNMAFDFGLIAAQVEAMEGRQEILYGGLQGVEREELSTRMRFKRRKLSEADLPPAPEIPPLTNLKVRLKGVLERFYPP